MADETKNGAEFLVTVPFDTKKQLSCTIKQFPTLVKATLNSLSLTPEQILQSGALDLIKDSVSKTLASEVGKLMASVRDSTGEAFDVISCTSNNRRAS